MIEKVIVEYFSYFSINNIKSTLFVTYMFGLLYCVYAQFENYYITVKFISIQTKQFYEKKILMKKKTENCFFH